MKAMTQQNLADLWKKIRANFRTKQQVDGQILLHLESYYNKDEVGEMIPLVYDDVDSVSDEKALSAKQGKLLQDQITELELQLSNLTTIVNSLSANKTDIEENTGTLMARDDIMEVDVENGTLIAKDNEITINESTGTIILPE